MVTSAEQAAAWDHGRQHQPLSVMIRTGNLVPAVAPLFRTDITIGAHLTPLFRGRCGDVDVPIAPVTCPH